MVERRVLILFFPMAFLLSWYPYILGKTHLVRTSGGINPLGPMVAALIVAAHLLRQGGSCRVAGPLRAVAHRMPEAGSRSNSYFAKGSKGQPIAGHTGLYPRGVGGLADNRMVEPYLQYSLHLLIR
jgi:hypothetical protein